MMMMMMMMMMRKALTLRVMGQDQQVDAGRPGAGAEDSDPLLVAPEMADILVEPAQSLDLIQQAVIPFSRLISSAQKACRRRARELDSKTLRPKGFPW